MNGGHVTQDFTITAVAGRQYRLGYEADAGVGIYNLSSANVIVHVELLKR
jgi:hypothetical protein